MINETRPRSYIGPYEPSYEEYVRADRTRKWKQVSLPLRELATYVDLLTELYGFKERRR